MKKGDLRRGQILDAAERLFFARGYDRTSVQDILDATNMSKGGFYHYFEAKETVLREICERRWRARFEAIRADIHQARRNPLERLNLLMGLANLFEAEDSRFAALMLKVCYRDGDASIRDGRRRALIDTLAEPLDDAVADGIDIGVLHTRYPAQIGRLMLLLACDVNDEACGILANNPDSPDRVIRVIELLNAYRESAELLCGAPFGSLRLFDPGALVSAWDAASAELDAVEVR